MKIFVINTFSFFISSSLDICLDMKKSCLIVWKVLLHNFMHYEHPHLQLKPVRKNTRQLNRVEELECSEQHPKCQKLCQLTCPLELLHKSDATDLNFFSCIILLSKKSMQFLQFWAVFYILKKLKKLSLILKILELLIENGFESCTMFTNKREKKF